jgi:hypothetical protein
MLQDGRIFGQITQNTPKKYFLAVKNWWPENGLFCPKVAEKRQQNLCWQFIGEIPSSMQFVQCLYTVTI